jgi:protein-S-isoprenylcysteine O-methyltransferase Ste14
MSALVIGIYFVCWALFHSLLASLRVKRLAGRIFGEAAKRWYRLGFVITAVLTLIPLLLLLLRLPDIPLYSVAPPWRWLMMAVQLAALVLLIWTIMSTEPLDFIGLKQISGAGSPYRNTLTTHGLYRLSRHPMYFASMLVMWLSPTMSVNLLTLFALMSLYFIVGSYHEEMLLVKQFGNEYKQYRRRVPRIFPGLPFPP